MFLLERKRGPRAIPLWPMQFFRQLLVHWVYTQRSLVPLGWVRSYHQSWWMGTESEGCGSTSPEPAEALGPRLNTLIRPHSDVAQHQVRGWSLRFETLVGRRRALRLSVLMGAERRFPPFPSPWCGQHACDAVLCGLKCFSRH